ncbi:unnamed protein product [Lactuca saligna]|uniref:Uncharacterized protein n=1 Tax=Lactuca saligna TaxID=75948 RepID=A0AA36E2V5_LACSI|nr:unnamed protein product [Lactuca saligna]
MVAPLPPPSLDIHNSVPKNITIHIKSIRISSSKRTTSPLSSPRSSKNPFPTHKWNPHLDEWIKQESIGFYDVVESSQAPKHYPIPEDPIDRGRDIDEMRILHTYDHLEETHYVVKYQHVMIESLEQKVREMELRLMVSEIDSSSQGKLGAMFLGLREGKVV